MSINLKRFSYLLCSELLTVAMILSWFSPQVVVAHDANPFIFPMADIPCDGSSILPQTEYDALGVFFTQMGGSNWANIANWGSTTVQVDDWFGVSCRDGHVTGLEFFQNNLSGDLASAGANLLNLPFLEVFRLGAERSVTGIIPPELNSLIHLKTLTFEEVPGITGSIPDLSSLSTLEILSLGDLNISGTIPNWVDQLSQLIVFRIYNTATSGAIPDQVCQLTNLKILMFNNFSMSGPIPVCMDKLVNLQNLDLSGSGLTGTIPDMFGTGKIDQLITLDLEMNYLKGPIPESITLLTTLLPVDPYYYGLYVTNFNYNLLTASDAVKTYFSSLDINYLNWAGAQTIPPIDLHAASTSINSVTLSWTPIDFKFGPGYYEIDFASDPGGPWYEYKKTVSKMSASTVIENLLSGTPYYFKIRSFTPFVYPETSLPSWTSDFSEPLSVTTLSGGIQTVIDPFDAETKSLVYQAPNGSTTTITIPAGAASSPVTLAFVPLTQYVGFNFTKKAFSLTAFVDGIPWDKINGQDDYPFSTPITILLEYNDEDLNGIDESQLAIWYYDVDEKVWRDIATTCNPTSTYIRSLENNWLQVDGCHLTEFALGSDKPYRINLPLMKRN